MSAEQLNVYLATHSYVGSPARVTLEDHKACGSIPGPVDAEKFPHLARWHKHITYLMEHCPTSDTAGNPLEKGVPPTFGAAAAPAPAKEEQQKKKEPKPKKEPAPKQEGKKKEKKEEKKQEAEQKDPDAERAAQKKRVIKEGGKRGVEIEGAADLGGLQFFCTAVEMPSGDIDMLVESLTAMNVKCDPAEEERKGGSGHIGKMIFSAGMEQLAVVAYVPEAKQDEISCEEWLRTVLAEQGGEFVSASKAVCTGLVRANADQGVFPLKIREPMILGANNFLRARGLFPTDNGDSDDDFVFGDDDFPS